RVFPAAGWKGIAEGKLLDAGKPLEASFEFLEESHLPSGLGVELAKADAGGHYTVGAYPERLALQVPQAAKQEARARKQDQAHGNLHRDQRLAEALPVDTCRAPPSEGLGPRRPKRSEERRVGKEWRSGRAREQEREKREG